MLSSSYCRLSSVNTHSPEEDAALLNFVEMHHLPSKIYNSPQTCNPGLWFCSQYEYYCMSAVVQVSQLTDTCNVELT